jgi:hypothetical protein
MPRRQHLLQVAKEAAASRKRSGDALSYAVALAAVISVESPFVHIDGIMVRLQPLGQFPASLGNGMDT